MVVSVILEVYKIVFRRVGFVEAILLDTGKGLDGNIISV